MLKSASFTYPAYYETYLQQVDFQLSLIENLTLSRDQAINFFATIPVDKEAYAYAEGKWTIKEVVQHCIDTERIFCYRALRFARNDQTELAGYDEVQYGREVDCSGRSLAQLMDEFIRLRNSSIDLFEHFTAKELARSGIASKQEISVEAIGYILTGHLLHHVEIIRERYIK